MVSFADPQFGHSGSMYKAANWTEIGTTSKSYFYQDDEGNEINKKVLYDQAKKQNMTERQYYESLNLKKIVTPAKIKFIYNL